MVDHYKRQLRRRWLRRADLIDQRGQPITAAGTLAPRGRCRRGRSPRSAQAAQPAPWGIVGVGVLVSLLAGSPGVAQTPSGGPSGAAPPVLGRLTVQPHAMVLGTSTARAGEQWVDSSDLEEGRIYVPQQCVGPRRCPLLVFTPDNGGPVWQPALLERYGIILVYLMGQQKRGDGPGADIRARRSVKRDPTDSFVIKEMSARAHEDVQYFDAKIKEILQRFAIDPDKIAVAGNSNAGDLALFLGSTNTDVFSRIGLITPETILTGGGPQNKATQYFILAGIMEGNSRIANEITLAQYARRLGHPVQLGLALKPHVHNVEDYELMWRWLAESWATPGSATQASPSTDITAATAGPLLMPQALSQLTAFWTSFLQLPDSIQTTARVAHRKQVTVLVGQEAMLMRMVDLPALAAQYPAVVAALASAGLTATQAEADRIAFIAALATLAAGPAVEGVAATSVLGQNIALLCTHLRAFNALLATRIWEDWVKESNP